VKSFVTQITILPKCHSIFGEMSTSITIEDEAAGCFLKVKQNDERTSSGGILIDESDWPILRDAIEQMFKVCDDIDRNVQG